MKKLAIAVAAVACASIVTAQTVTSANVVGYNKKAVQAGLQMHGMQFIGSADATPTSVFGSTLPVGSKVYIWTNDGAGSGSYAIATFIQPRSLRVPCPSGTRIRLLDWATVTGPRLRAVLLMLITS
jgi:hypothetical protein